MKRKQPKTDAWLYVWVDYRDGLGFIPHMSFLRTDPDARDDAQCELQCHARLGIPGKNTESNSHECYSLQGNQTRCNRTH